MTTSPSATTPNRRDRLVAQLTKLGYNVDLIPPQPDPSHPRGFGRRRSDRPAAYPCAIERPVTAIHVSELR